MVLLMAVQVEVVVVAAIALSLMVGVLAVVTALELCWAQKFARRNSTSPGHLRGTARTGLGWQN